jgi:tyrosyl-tRNA synthetase
VKYLKYFTFLSVDEIQDAEQAVHAAPQERAAQRRLAEEVTRLVHGDEGLNRAQRATELLFDKHADYRQLTAQELEEAFRGAPTTTIARAELGGEAAKLVNLLAETSLYPSRGRARKDIPSGGVSLNNRPIRDPEYVVGQDDLLSGDFVILRKGKKTYHVLQAK